jgi:chromosomal replication initiator protein
MDTTQLWNAALAEIEVSISKAQFGTWFKRTGIISIEKNGVVFIRVANGFAKEWLENKFHLIIIRALGNLGYPVKEVRCKIEEIASESIKPQGIDGISAPGSSSKPSSISSKTTPPISNQWQSNLNPRYTFGDFIVGEHNELAHAACLAVCEHLGEAYNPLFLYGGVGLGKTHLLQSVGNRVLEQCSDKRVLYTTSERFMQALISSIQNRSVEAFKEKHLAIDLLIIDDVQFLSGKEKTQNEFFHIFNTLYQQNKQIVISSDRPPKAIATLEDRLRSRFEGGMIADVSRPDMETRLAILERKVRQRGMLFSEEVLRYIAENFHRNIRELEGAVNRLHAVSQFRQLPSITLNDAQSILKDSISGGKKKTVGQQDILTSITEFYGVSLDDLKKKGRKKEIASARQIAMYFLREKLHMPYTGIGRLFGGRDHTTAIHAHEKIQSLLKTDEKTRKDILYLEEKISYIS